MEPTAELVNQWQEYANQVQAQLDESTACNTQWSTYAEQLQQEKSDLEAKLANSSTPVDNNAQIKQLTAEKASLQSQWSDAVNRCSNLEQQLKSCSGAVEAKRAALDQNGALQKQLAQLQTEKDTEVASLTEQVRSLQEQLSVFATQVRSSPIAPPACLVRVHYIVPFERHLSAECQHPLCADAAPQHPNRFSLSVTVTTVTTFLNHTFNHR